MRLYMFEHCSLCFRARMTKCTGSELELIHEPLPNARLADFPRDYGFQLTQSPMILVHAQYGEIAVLQR